MLILRCKEGELAALSHKALTRDATFLTRCSKTHVSSFGLNFASTYVLCLLFPAHISVYLNRYGFVKEIQTKYKVYLFFATVKFHFSIHLIKKIR